MHSSTNSQAAESRRFWTKEEDDLIVGSYVSNGADWIARMTGRSKRSVWARAIKLGVKRKRRWTPGEHRKLLMMWGEWSVKRIAKVLKRTPKAVFEQATVVYGLPSSAGGDCESLFTAAERTGFHLSTFRRILEWAQVWTPRAMTRPSSKKMRRCVDPDDADEAVKKWLASETPEDAAKRFGCSSHRIRAALAGVNGIPKRPGGKRHWRIPSEKIDAAMAAYRPDNARWTASEDAVLKSIYPRDGAPAVAQATGRTRNAVRRRAMALGISRVWKNPKSKRTKGPGARPSEPEPSYPSLNPTIRVRADGSARAKTTPGMEQMSTPST